MDHFAWLIIPFEASSVRRGCVWVNNNKIYIFFYKCGKEKKIAVGK